jgi:hypothetical protein
MDITVYLPDEIGSWAKTNDLNLSRILRDAVEHERDRRAAVEQTLGDVAVHELEVENADGYAYTARVHGTQIAGETDDGICVFLTAREQLIVYETAKYRLVEGVDACDLRDWLRDDHDYLPAMSALGEKAIIDIGQATS